MPSDPGHLLFPNHPHALCLGQKFPKKQDNQRTVLKSAENRATLNTSQKEKRALENGHDVEQPHVFGIRW